MCLGKIKHDTYFKKMVSLTNLCKLSDKNPNISYDIEKAMGIADKILCDMLIELGYQDIIIQYKKIGW